MEAQGMVERVAAAILAEAQNMGGLAFTIPIEKRLALVAIKAMREPTDEMNQAGAMVGDYPWDGRKPARIMAAMIDAALNEHQEKRGGE